MNNNIICTICVRTGSKGVEGKNIRLMHGKPLLAYSIEQAKQSCLFDCIAVSSDSQKILDIALVYGADQVILRPYNLADDNAAKPPAIAHCVETVEEKVDKKFEIIVDLDATSPLRSVDDICNAVKLLQTSGAGNVITGTQSYRSPYFNMVEKASDGTIRICKTLNKSIVRRQDAPQCFDMNASIYVWSREAFFKGPIVFRDDTQIYLMPPERSMDIDKELDWDLVQFLMYKKGV